MSNFPHSASIASSLSTSPFAVQSNLEALISRSRTHPHPRRPSSSAGQSDQSPYLPPHPSSAQTSPLIQTTQLPAPHPAGRRPSDLHQISTIREASYDDGAAILLGNEDDDDADEGTKLLGKGSRRASEVSRKSGRSGRRGYGGTGHMSEPLGMTKRSSSRGERRGAGGNSRSRSKARTPPRDGAVDAPSSSAEDEDEDGSITPPASFIRGRRRDSRALSSTTGAGRRMSMSTRLAEDSSGDEGGDVVRGLLATGGGAMLGGSRSAGFGVTPASASAAGMGAGMEVDPVMELDARDLELPIAEDGEETRDALKAFRAEIPIIVRSAIPAFFTQLAEYSLVLASVISIGHLGTTELAASSLASMTASVSSFSILQGLATALDTLLPAAWTSSDPSRVGLWTQRTSVVLAVSMIPMFVLWWNVEGVLLALGQDADVAALAGVYLKWLSFGIPGYGGNILIKKYLQAQNLMRVPTYTLFICAPVNLLLNYLLVWGPPALRLGFKGGALATALSYDLNFALSLAYSLFLGPREAFHPWRFRHVFSKLGTVTSLGLAGTIMLSSEWWAWEACALAASLLGPTTLAAQSVLLSTASTFFQVPASLGIASAVRVGNLLGAGRGWEAMWASRAAMALSIVLALVNSAILIIFRENWGYLFNIDPDVVAIVASIMPYIALFQVTDGYAATTGSVLRALGLHTTGALVNLSSYYVIGLPIGLWLAFSPRFSLGLIGLWAGLSVALGYASIVSFWLVWRADWTRAVERVRERLGLGADGQVGEDGKWDGRPVQRERDEEE